MAKRLEQSKQKRDQCFSTLDRIQIFIDSLATTDRTIRQKFEIQGRLDKLPAIWEQFENAQTVVESDSSSTDDDVRNKFETQYFGLHACMQELIEQFKNSDPNSQSSPGASPGPSKIVTHVQLPVMSLPKFNGEYDRWLEFRDSFLSLVDSNQALPDIQKFYHLRSCLEAEALETIKAIPVSGDNYSVAWQQLIHRYEKSHLIANNHVNAILKHPAISKESCKALRNLYNSINNNLKSLKNLEVPVQHWDLLLIPIVSAKLDSVTLREWERFSTDKKEVSFQNLLDIINKRADFLEKLENKLNLSDISPKPQNKVHSKFSNNKFFSASHTQSIEQKCKICNKDHPTYRCKSFLSMTIGERIKSVKRAGLCLNCLKSSHLVEKCWSSKCKKCGKSHNTLLHPEQKSVEPQSSDSTNDKNSVALTQIHPKENYKSLNQVILPTAIISIIDKHEQRHECRALLDSGAMSNFVSAELCKKLGLPTRQVDCSISGVGHSVQKTHLMTKVQFSSIFNTNLKFEASCLVMDKITANLPMFSFDQTKFKIPKSVKLADRNFNKSDKIDILLGSSIFWDLLLGSRIKLTNSGLTLTETKLGWIVGGQFAKHNDRGVANKHSVNGLVTLHDSLDDRIKKFWEIEQIDFCQSKSPEDQYCEESFKNTHIRGKDGRYIVEIPFKSTVKDLGDSRESALKRFMFLEQRFSKNKQLFIEYSKIMNEYISMNHMKEIDENVSSERATYYLPHHAVIKKDSLTTKIRVVFDASMKSSSGLSLNDVQYIGPTIQRELFSTLINFRLHKYIISSDISKMYRMIWLNDKHKQFHRIFWRENNQEPLKCYELQTVTFGTASAPFLAIRCLHQIAIEHEKIYPEASRIIQNNFYVDDLIYGAETISQLIQLQHEISTILSSAGFYLRKWLCNHKDIYNKLKLNPDLECNTLQIGDKDNKTLGVIWNAQRDEILYSKLQLKQNSFVTKRIILSELSKLFDPLGLLGPIITSGKLLMQKLWQMQISWDEPVSTDIKKQWAFFRNEIDDISLIKIKRKVLVDNYSYVEIHGFCDASEKAYGAAVYIRSQNRQGEIQTSLVCSKSRVAPLKVISLPRLELCGAVLLAQLIHKMMSAIEIKIEQIHYWSDSTIVLSWMKSFPGKWKTFVANRVSEIQRLTSIQDWHHISSADNPADLLSRGTTIKKLINNQLWWSGPSWLSTDSWAVNQELPVAENLPEEKVQVSVNAAITAETFDIINKYSTFKKLQRIVAYCFRFTKNCQNPLNQRQFGELTVEELNLASNTLIRLSQQQSFSEEYKNLNSQKTLNSKSHLLSLNPFLDENKIIRVGGRLGNSQLNFDSKHPIILHPKHQLSKLLVRQIHSDNFHCGPTTLLAIVRQKYWPVNGRNLIKGITRSCKICFLAKPRACRYLMGQLPSVRISQAFPFQNVGVDYAGPILIKDRKTRNYKTLKAYICLFICLVTKAVHLECVTDLTTEGFLACFRRFVGRRGKPSHIYSDNGKNFIGANNDIKHFYKFIKDQSDSVQKFLAHEQISWHFIPARTPTFGGVWEAAIKNVKTYLTKLMRNTKLHYEDLNTLLCQIESVINSRPLVPLTSDPSDLNPLTPGHFLIGRTFTQHPEISSPSVVPTSRLKQFQLINSITNQFWRRWSAEYISQLQVRNKWQRCNPDDQAALKVGKLVLVKEDNTSVLQWPLGRITQLHPGPDGIVRAVSLKMRDSIIKRGISKVCVLPED